MRAHDPEEPTALPSALTSVWRAEQDRNGIPNFERLHHILRGRLLEMSRLDIELIRIYVGVQLEDEGHLAVGQNGRDCEPQARAGSVPFSAPALTPT
jgi:hypothetical protein